MVPAPERKPEQVNDRALLVWSPTKEIPDSKCESLLEMIKITKKYIKLVTLSLIQWRSTSRWPKKSTDTTANRRWACCSGTSTTSSGRCSIWPTLRPSPTSGPSRIRSCSSRHSSSTARAFTASDKWWVFCLLASISTPASVTQLPFSLSASGQIDRQPGQVLLLVEEDAQPDQRDGPAGEDEEERQLRERK